MAAQRKIAKYLHKGESVPPALAKNLADLLAKEQRSRLGQLQNMRKRGGAALMGARLHLNSGSSKMSDATDSVAKT
jgi:hypothetical protein